VQSAQRHAAVRRGEQERDLASKIVGAGEQWITELDGKELQSLFALSDGAVVGGDDVGGEDDDAKAPVRTKARAPRARSARSEVRP
jgi:hypothetical protein